MTRADARRRTPVWAALIGVAVAGCMPGVDTCPAIGYGGVLTVELSGRWAPSEDPVVAITCPDEPSCLVDAPVADDAGTWRASLSSSPAHVVVTVTDGGVVVAEVPVELTWRVVERPHGPRCGGPTAAEVVLDLPA
jgi:hypothetical protein